jgi:DNA-binding ferritin-like protein (Dps family)
MMEENNYDKEYQELEKKIQHIKVGAKTLMIILEYVLDIVEHVEGIKGNKKKTLAILLITKVVENATLDEDDKNLCMAMIDNGVIGDTIDLVVNAHNGKLDFGDVVETGSKCCFFILLKMLSDRKDNRQKNRQTIKAKE